MHELEKAIYKVPESLLFHTNHCISSVSCSIAWLKLLFLTQKMEF